MKLISMFVAITFLFMNSAVFAGHHENESSDEKSEEKKEFHKKMRNHYKSKRHDRMSKMMLEKIDTNEDGKVDLKEYMDHAEQRFKSSDINDDGFLTPEEGKAAAQQMREKHREEMKKNREERRKSYREREDNSK